jgi:hypothetical protein
VYKKCGHRLFYWRTVLEQRHHDKGVILVTQYGLAHLDFVRIHTGVSTLIKLHSAVLEKCGFLKKVFFQKENFFKKK